jgi:hypothetical protein
MFNTCSSSKKCLSARLTLADNIFVGTLTYLEHNRFILIIFYNGTFLMIKTLNVPKMNVYVHIDTLYSFLSQYNYWRDCDN